MAAFPAGTETVLIHIAISNRVSDNTNRRMPPYMIKLKFGQRLRRCNVHLCSSQLLIRYSPDELWNGVAHADLRSRPVADAIFRRRRLSARREHPDRRCRRLGVESGVPLDLQQDHYSA